MIPKIILLDLNLTFCKKELIIFHLLWKKGYSLQSISEHIEREVDELALLVIDLAEKGYIEQRNHGLDWSKKTPKNKRDKRLENMIKELSNLYYCLEDYKFDWTIHEIKECISLWNRKVAFKRISNVLNVEIIDLALLLMHLSRTNLIEPRKRGLEDGRWKINKNNKKCKSKRVDYNCSLRTLSS